MKAIEGIDLAALAAQAKTEQEEARKLAILRSIKDKYIERAATEVDITQAEKVLSKAREKLTRIDTFITAVNNGQWEVVGFKDENG